MNTIKQWLVEKGNWQLIAGALMLGLAMPGINLWPLAWVGMIPLLFSLKRCVSPRQALRQGLIWGSLYHGVLFIWFWGLHPLTWMGFPAWFSFIVTLLGWSIASVSQGVIVSIIWLGLFFLWRLKPYGFVILAPLLWVLGLWFLNQNPIGLPWGFLTYSQASLPWVRESSYTLSFWGLEYCIVLVNVALFQALRTRQARWMTPAFVTVFMILLCGRTNVPMTNLVFSSLQPVAIQGNLPIEAERLFISELDKQQYYQALLDQTLGYLPRSTQLILLPEGVIPPRNKTDSKPFLLPPAVALLSGGTYRQQNAIYNGALLFPPDGLSQQMGKRYLVPFGEMTPFIPEEWLIMALKYFNIGYGKGFQAGSLHQPPLTFGSNKIGPLICFEALYPNLTHDYQARHVNLLVTFSNLGWYHQQPFLEKQFLAINQMRAAEAGIPLILITNTGLSAFISEQGQILSTAPSGKTTFLTPTHSQEIVLHKPSLPPHP